jgi:hypothetical protein
MVMFCAKATVAAKRNTKGVKVREKLRTKNPPEGFCHVAHTSTLTPGCEIHQVDVLSGRSGRSERARLLVNGSQFAFSS